MTALPIAKDVIGAMAVGERKVFLPNGAFRLSG